MGGYLRSNRHFWKKSGAWEAWPYLSVHLPFSMSFQKIKTVKSEETQISVSSKGGAGGDQAARIANVGNVGSGNKIEDENSFKEKWRQWVRAGMGTKEEYQEQWGVPYPQ